MPEMTDPKQMREATRSYLGKKEAYGPLLEKQEAKTVSGGTVAFWLVNVFSLLDGICRAGGAFYDLLRSCAEKAGGRALRFAIYSDEVIPGNVLAARTSRKSWCIYLSCIDFPAQVLAMEEAWLTIALLRSSFVASLEGSISQIFKIIFRSIFLHSKHDPAAGVWMQGPKGGFHLSFEPSMVIQDGAAHKFAWSVKGDSGSKYCLLCGNQRADNRNEEKIPKHAHADLHLVSDDDIWDSWSRLADLKGRCSAKDFGMWQQATGWTFNTESIFSEPLLRRVVKPATMFVHDWMHCCLSNGTLNDATWLLLSATKDHGFKDVFATLEKYVDLWTQPASFAHVKLKQVFENKRMKSCREAGKFKTTASEMLSLLPVLAFFVRTCILDKGFLPSECEAFLQMCLMVELLQAACHGHGCVLPSMLREAADKCMSSWFETGWGEHVTRKMHWLLHMGDHYEKHKRLPATFSMERKHRTITRYAASIQNTSTFERSLYEEVLAHELWHLEKLPEFPVALALENPRQKPPTKLRDLVLQSFPQVSKDDLKIATILRLPGGGLASKADVCLLQADKGRDPPWDCAEVFCHVSVQGTLWSVVSLWSLQEYNKDKHCAVWTEMEQPVIIESKDILTAVVYLRDTNCIPRQYGEWACREERENGINMSADLKRFVLWFRRKSEEKEMKAGPSRREMMEDPERYAKIPYPGSASSRSWEEVSAMSQADKDQRPLTPSSCAAVTPLKASPTKRGAEKNTTKERMHVDPPEQVLEEIRALEQSGHEDNEEMWEELVGEDQESCVLLSENVENVLAEAILKEDYSAATLTSILEATFGKNGEDFPNRGARARKRAMGENDTGGCRISLGYYTYGSMRGICANTSKYASLCIYLKNYFLVKLPDAKWSSLSIAFNCQPRVHADFNNLKGTLNYITCAGDFTDGGGLWQENGHAKGDDVVLDPKDREIKGKVLPTLGSIVSFVPERFHSAQAWTTGNRWSVTAFSTRGFAGSTQGECRQLRLWGFPLHDLRHLSRDRKQIESGIQDAFGRLADLRTSDGQAHWQSGFTERHGKWWKEIFARVVQDQTVRGEEVEEAIAATSSAKNELRRRCGWAPCQIVFGKNPRGDDDLRFEVEEGGGELLRTPDSAQQRRETIRNAAKLSFFKSRTEDKIRRGMSQRARVKPRDLDNGAMVLFWRKPANKKTGLWKGPGTIIGRQDNNYWVSHSGRCYLCAPEHLRKALPEELGGLFALRATKDDLLRLVEKNYDDSAVFPAEDDAEIGDKDLFDAVMDLSEPEGDEGEAETGDMELDNGDLLEEGPPELPRDDLPRAVRRRFSTKRPEPYDAAKEKETVNEAHMLKRATTKRGRDKQLEKEIPWSMIPESKRQLFIDAEHKQWEEHLRLGALRPLDLAESAEKIKSGRVLSSRFAYRDKNLARRRTDPTVEWKAKSRLVVSGHTDPDIVSGALRTDSPTVSRTAVMTLLQLAASQLDDDWGVAAGDVTAAFLNGEKLDRELYLRQPKHGLPGLHPDQLIKIEKGVFGLIDSPRKWWKKFKKDIQEMTIDLPDNKKGKFFASPLDPCVFQLIELDADGKRGTGPPLCYAAVHVDDILLAGPRALRTSVQGQLSKCFPVDEWEEDVFDFIDSHIETRHDGIFAPGDALADAEQIADNRSLVGALSWLASQSRPDLACGVSMCQQLQARPTIEDIRFTNTMAKRALLHKEEGILLAKIPLNEMVVTVFHDAGWSNAPDSNADPIYFLYEEDEKNGMITEGPWVNKARKTKKKNSSVASQLGTLVMLCGKDGIKHPGMGFELGQYVRAMIDSFLTGKITRDAGKGILILGVADCRSLYDHMHRDGLPRTPSDRRLAIDIGCLRQTLMEETAECDDARAPLVWVPTHLQRADILTKPKLASDWWPLSGRLSLPLKAGNVVLKQCKSEERCQDPIRMSEHVREECSSA
ncbi:RE1 [Symbiodinium sp. CCMP2592]|nr:RE1 [Symbiodinium sp. CCMP2592]